MSTTTPTSNAFSDFHFVAHDAHPKQKRQIPTVVRAHVMGRYHREKRAKDGETEKGSSVWFQSAMTLPTPTRRGQILRWDHDTEKKPKKERCKARVRVKQIILANVKMPNLEGSMRVSGSE